jgi:hypothetical protein
MAMMDNHGAEGAYTFEEYCSSKGGMEGTGLTGYPKGKGKGKDKEKEKPSRPSSLSICSVSSKQPK